MNVKLEKISKDLAEAIKTSNQKGTQPYDTPAKVVRIDGDIAWVHINGGVDETPVKKSIDCKVGDTVQVRVGGGTAWITGNMTAPPTDDTEAVVAKLRAELADKKAVNALTTADEALKYSEDNAIDMAKAVLKINDDIEKLQSQIDGNITSWFYDTDPAMNKPPVTEWTTDAEKNTHVGDLYYNTVSGYVWRFIYQNGAYSWTRVEDSDVTRALELATKAQDTADSKRRVFYETPVPPYDKGDLWVQGSNGDILRCNTAKIEGQSYQRSDWVLASKYTDDSALNDFMNGSYATTIQTLTSQIDQKAETWYQSSDPSSNWTSAQKTAHKGDLWYRTTDGKTFRYTGSGWQEQQVPNAVFDRIDGKAQIFVSQPTVPYHKGDLWFNSTSSDIMTCINTRTTGSYTSSDWQKRNKYTDDTVAREARTIANNTNQFFWHAETGDDTGAHITEVSKDTFLQDPENGGFNTIIKSNKFAIRDGLTDHSIFGIDGVRIGLPEGSHIEMEDDNGFKVYDEIGQLAFSISPSVAREIDFIKSISESDAVIETDSQGYKKLTWKLAKTPVDNNMTHAFINNVQIDDIHQGSKAFSIDSSNFLAILDGKLFSVQQVGGNVYSTPITGEVGYTILASRPAMSLGDRQGEYGAYSFTRGMWNEASGDYSYAGGANAHAIDNFAYADGEGVIAKMWQHVFGRYNDPDVDFGCAFMVGNGGSDGRSNAMAVDDDGNLHLKGTVYSGCNANSSCGAKLGAVTKGNGTATLANTTSIVKLATLTSLTAGSWIITVGVRFKSTNATGSRAFTVYVGSNEERSAYVSFAGENTTQSDSVTIPLELTSTQTISLYARQGSGKSMEVDYYWTAMRIS